MQARFQFEGFLGCRWARFVFLVWMAGPVQVHGADRTIQLAWGPSASPDVTGYIIVYGFESGRYVLTNNAARALQAPVTLPVSGETYYFAAQARNRAGYYSEPSNEVSYQLGADPLDPWVIRLTMETAENTPVQQTLSLPPSVPATVSLLFMANPTHGNLTVTPTNLTYVPQTNYTGTDSFRLFYGGDKTRVVKVEVLVIVGTNAASMAAMDDNFTTPEDKTLTVSAPGLLANDGDGSENSLTAALVISPAHGKLTLNENGSFTYKPAANYNGTDRFIYKVSDGSLGLGEAAVRIQITPVNDAPEAASDSTYTTPEDTPLVVDAPGVLANDSDIDGDPLNTVLESSPAHGTLSLNGNGSFIYTPAANYNGTDTFSYRASDGNLRSGMTTVKIKVTPVNDAPAAAVDSYSTPEDTTLTVGAPGVLANDLDIERSQLKAVLVSSPAHGTLTLASNGSFNYRPATTYNGTDSFTYKASDGSLESGEATVTIAISPVNDAPPAAADDSYSTPEDTVLIVTAPGLLANDSDFDGSPLNALLVSSPTHGVLTTNADGSFSYVPAANYNGNDSFTYKVSDGSLESPEATVTITITPVNDAPVAATEEIYTTPEDTPLTVNALGVLSNDNDVDGDPLNAALVTGPTHGTLTLNGDGSFTYTPATNFNGLDSFTYKASDGNLESEETTVSIIVTPVNDAPVAAAEETYTTPEDTTLTVNALGVLSNDNDVDGDPLNAALVTGPTHGTLTLNSDGSFTYTPATNFNGLDSFTYKASDGSLESEESTVSIIVTPVNDAPVAATEELYTTPEDTPLTVNALGVLSNDNDVDGDPLHAVLVTGPTHGTLALNSDGSFTYTPATNFNGLDSFTYKASDGNLESEESTVTIVVTPVDDAPVEITAAHSVAGELELSWPSMPGMSYRVLHRPELGTGDWAPASEPFSATGPVARWKVPAELISSSGFFRLEISVAAGP